MILYRLYNICIFGREKVSKRGGNDSIRRHYQHVPLHQARNNQKDDEVLRKNTHLGRQ